MRARYVVCKIEPNQAFNYSSEGGFFLIIVMKFVMNDQDNTINHCQ